MNAKDVLWNLTGVFSHSKAIPHSIGGWIHKTWDALANVPRQECRCIQSLWAS